MQYVKKMCILRQIKQGFSGDGKALSGLIKIEQYGKNVAVEVSIINFAPLVSGEYYCLLSDGKGKTEMLALRGKSLFNILSDLDISAGFCAVICYVKREIVPIAYGINGNGKYDWRAILNATLPPVFPMQAEENALAKDDNFPNFNGVSAQNDGGRYEMKSNSYDDESVAEEDYFQKEEEDAQIMLQKDSEDARAESASQDKPKEEGTDATENGNVAGVRRSFQTSADGYYLSVKEEIDKLFSQYPKDETLNGAFSCSQWVRLKGTKENPDYLVGVLYMHEKVGYICYALRAQDKDNPPEEIRDVCSYVPVSPYKPNEGFFVLFQSATTGECIKPERA